MNAYRQSPFSNLTPVVKNLLIINIIFFVGTWLLSKQVNLEVLFSAFYFNSPYFHPWQIITYMFMHANIVHIGFNMLGLYFLGPMLEYTMGSKRFLQYYFITGVGALLVQWIVQAIEVHNLIGSFIIPHGDYMQFQGYAFYEKLEAIYLVPVLGASGAIFG
ncbi:MAG: rhomboid family intramembrane serine protease, partial [Mucilaginibacter sp.]